MRREVADTFRAATECLGVPAVRQQLLQLAQQTQAAWQWGGSWQEYECGLYALNLVWAKQRSAQPGAACVAEARQAAALVAAALQPGLPKLAGTALTLLGGMAEQLPLLETSRQEQPALQQQQQQPSLPQHHHQQQSQQPPLQHLLSLLVQLLQQAHDDKLSRNAATCCSRLAAHRPLAALLVARHPSWSDALCACFATASSQQPQHAQHGEDQPTSQFLLSAICHLAAASAEAGPPAESGQAAAAAASQRGSQLLQQLLSQPAAAAEAALAAAAAALDAELKQQQLGQAAVHVQIIAVALEAAAGSSTSGGSGSKELRRNGLAEQLPVVLASLAGVLQQAAAAAAAAASAQLPGDPLLLQALCRVAAATAPTPAAGAGLQLLQPFAAAPQHPCVLLALTAMAGSSFLQDSMPQLQHAVSACIQAAAAQHAGNPDWQAALLQLGEACLAHLPAVAADAAALDALLGAAQHSMRSYHRAVCEQAVSFAEALCCAGSCAPAASGAGQGPAAAAARHQLQQRLDGGGLGAALVLGLLLAAAGAMPPYMIIAIADALHRTWRAAGNDRCGGSSVGTRGRGTGQSLCSEACSSCLHAAQPRSRLTLPGCPLRRFAAWLRIAALESAPEDAPWRRWKLEAQQAAVADLLSTQCAQDARRFKRLLKVCGGFLSFLRLFLPSAVAASRGCSRRARGLEGTRLRLPLLGKAPTERKNVPGDVLPAWLPLSAPHCVQVLTGGKKKGQRVDQPAKGA